MYQDGFWNNYIWINFKNNWIIFLLYEFVIFITLMTFMFIFLYFRNSSLYFNFTQLELKFFSLAYKLFDLYEKKKECKSELHKLWLKNNFYMKDNNEGAEEFTLEDKEKVEKKYKEIIGIKSKIINLLLEMKNIVKEVGKLRKKLNTPTINIQAKYLQDYLECIRKERIEETEEIYYVTEDGKSTKKKIFEPPKIWE